MSGKARPSPNLTANGIPVECETLRIDKWLWHARFFKSRSQATRLAADGRIRVDGKVVTRAHHPVKVGNVLTFPVARRICVVRILALGARRGPATEARTLYEDLMDRPAATEGQKTAKKAENRKRA